MTEASAESLTALQGSLPVRALLQIALAATFAVVHGLRDGQTRRRPRFWSGMGAPTLYSLMTQDLWPSLGKLLLFGLALDAFSQAMVLDVGSALEAIAIALVVAIPIYLILRAVIAWAAAKLRPFG